MLDAFMQNYKVETLGWGLCLPVSRRSSPFLSPFHLQTGELYQPPGLYFLFLCFRISLVSLTWGLHFSFDKLVIIIIKAADILQTLLCALEQLTITLRRQLKPHKLCVVANVLSNSRKEIGGVGQRAHMYPLLPTIFSSSAIIGLESAGINVHRWDPLNMCVVVYFHCHRCWKFSGSDLGSGDKECNYFPEMQMGSFDYIG